MSIIIPSAAPRSSTTAEAPDILSANLRYECNCTYYWLFVGNVCLTAAQAKISSVRKHTRRLQELIEESEDAQETILDAPYTGIVDDLVTQLLKVPEIVERIGMFNWVFRDVATLILPMRTPREKCDYLIRILKQADQSQIICNERPITIPPHRIIYLGLRIPSEGGAYVYQTALRILGWDSTFKITKITTTNTE